MNSKFSKWVACWGTATSIADQNLSMYAKNVTLRYPIPVCFDGNKLRFRFSNLTGTEPVSLKVFVAKSTGDRTIDTTTSKSITLEGNTEIILEPGAEKDSDELAFAVTAGEKITVSIYLENCTQMNSGTLVTGPLSKGFYAYGNEAENADLNVDMTRNTNWYYFLNTIEVFTEEKNHALICYGDSITAQSWPDYLAIRAWEEGYRDVAIIRRAVCGTRILRQYDCITYAAYGLKGATRFPIEVKAAGADTVLIQHGINDIIHPVGTDVNIFRPWSDMPTLEDLTEGYTDIYINHAKELGMKVWGGTLVPIYNWRTYADFRENLKNEFNDWLRERAPLDGCVDFDLAVRDEEYKERFKEGFDSGDHLHPSESAYKAMAEAVPAELLGKKGEGKQS